LVGFLTILAGFVSYYSGLIFGWITLIPLKFEIFMIEFFAKLSLPISANLGLFFAALYYLFIIGFIFYVSRKNVRKT
ncbi:MAG: hypothetical protein AAB935_00530, partial [Patescibacteria group bacterium]